jgi:hypothetical protein
LLSLLEGHRPNDTDVREPINIRPAVRERLAKLLYQPELRGVGYSSFIERACEVAETEIADRRAGRRS